MTQERNKAPQRKSPPDAFRAVGAIVKTALAIVLVSAFISGLAWLGQNAGRSVAPAPRYTFPLASIESPTPPNIDQATFLTEVRYLGNLPETLQTVDPETPARLQKAFSLHPWVREAGAVSIAADGRVRIDLTFRTPTLVITTSGEPPLRVLDSAGVLLPSTAPTDGLARLMNATTSVGTAGQPWPDADVRRAAELVVAHPAIKIEKKKTEWIITQQNNRILRVAGP